MKKKPDFLLDCNAVASRLPQYNGLIDSNLVYFFSSKNKRKQLCTLGLINKQGVVLDNNKKSASPRRIVGGRHEPSASYTNKKNKAPVKPVTKDQFQAVIASVRKNHTKNTIEEDKQIE